MIALSVPADEATVLLEWKERPLTLRTDAFVGASFLTVVQVLVALFLNGEHVSLCKRPANWGGFDPSHHPLLFCFWAPPGDYCSEPVGPGLLNRDSHNSKYFIVLIFVSNLATITVGRSSPLWPPRRAAEVVPRAALALEESRAALLTLTLTRTRVESID